MEETLEYLPEEEIESPPAEEGTAVEPEQEVEGPAAQEETTEDETLSEEEIQTSEAVPEGSDPSAEPAPADMVSVLDVDSLTINVSEGVTITGLSPEAEEEAALPVLYASGNALNLTVPDNFVVFEMGDKQLVFPSAYVDDLTLIDGYLVNFGSPVTIAVNLQSTATVSNYIVSQVTFPTYGSSDYITYVTAYGGPYRIVDRYRNSSGSVTSYTRPSVSAITSQEIVQPGWYGFSGGRMYLYAFAVIVIFIMIWGRLRWKH